MEVCLEDFSVAVEEDYSSDGEDPEMRPYRRLAADVLMRALKDGDDDWPRRAPSLFHHWCELAGFEESRVALALKQGAARAAA